MYPFLKRRKVPPLPVEDIRKPAVMDYQFEEEDEEELVQQLQKEELDHESLKHQIKASHAIPLTSSLETNYRRAVITRKISESKERF